MTPKTAGRDDRRFTENPAAEFLRSPGFRYPCASPEAGFVLLGWCFVANDAS